MTRWRGYPIHLEDGRFVFTDTGESTASTWKSRPCGHCGRHNTEEGHDACLGTLHGVLNACCGHGEPEDAYVQLEGGEHLQGEDAVEFFRTCLAQ